MPILLPSWRLQDQFLQEPYLSQHFTVCFPLSGEFVIPAFPSYNDLDFRCTGCPDFCVYELIVFFSRENLRVELHFFTLLAGECPDRLESRCPVYAASVRPSVYPASTIYSVSGVMAQSPSVSYASEVLPAYFPSVPVVASVPYCSRRASLTSSSDWYEPLPAVLSHRFLLTTETEILLSGSAVIS